MYTYVPSDVSMPRAWLGYPNHSCCYEHKAQTKWCLLAVPALHVSKDTSGTRVARSRQVSCWDVPPDTVTIEGDVVPDFQDTRAVIVARDDFFMRDSHAVNI